MIEKGDVSKIILSIDEDQKKSAGIADKVLAEYPEVSGMKKQKLFIISHSYVPLYQSFIDQFAESEFFSDDSFYSAVSYYQAVALGKKITSYHNEFNPGKITGLKKNEMFDLVYSSMGLSFSDIYNLLPALIGLLNLNGYLMIEFPAFWFFRDALNPAEKSILEYASKNDKRWIFTESIDPLIADHHGKIVKFSKTNEKFTYDRQSIAFISSLEKLWKAHLEHNRAILEVCGISDNNLDVSKGILIIKKESRTLTKDNLFSL